MMSHDFTPRSAHTNNNFLLTASADMSGTEKYTSVLEAEEAQAPAVEEPPKRRSSFMVDFFSKKKRESNSAAPASPPPPPADAAAGQGRSEAPEAHSSVPAQPAPAAIAQASSAPASKPKGLIDGIKMASDFSRLAEALVPLQSWDYAAEQLSAIDLSTAHVRTLYDEPSEVLCAFVVSSVNEWKVCAHPRGSSDQTPAECTPPDRAASWRAALLLLTADSVC